MFRWARTLPFWDRIGPTFVFAQVLLVIGLATCVIGWAMADAGTIVAGLMALAPGAFAWFLLWRTYADDGYKEDRDGYRHQKDN